MRPLFAAAGHQFYAPTYTGLGERAHLAKPEIDLSVHIQDVVGVLDTEDLKDVTLIGQSLFDLVGTHGADSMRGKAMAEGGGWRIPANPMPPDTAPEDVTWAAPRRRSQPLKTFEQKISLTMGKELPPRHFIYATRPGPGDVFRQFGERAKSEPGWKYYEIEASHNPHITCPETLRDLVLKIMAT